MSKKKTPAKKKAKAKRPSVAVATPKAVHDALNRMIGLSDHDPSNEGREFTFVITNEIFDVLGKPRTVDTSLISKPGFLRQLQEEFIPQFVKDDYSKHAILHEVIDVEDQTEDGVWIAVTLKILNIYVSKAGPDSFDYYRKVEIAATKEADEDEAIPYVFWGE